MSKDSTSMKLSSKAQGIHLEVNQPNVKLGDLRVHAKSIKKDHSLALELWSTGSYFSRQLANLIFDNKLMTEELIDRLDRDIYQHPIEERTQLIDWLMANQLSKNRKTIALMESWERSSSALQRRLFWYHQARLRWMGHTDHQNTELLLASIEKNLLKEEPEVQWAMNYTAGQIGKWQEEYRERCILIGENSGLYKDEKVSKGCTPSYLPEFISIEVAKLEKRH